jgi:hypothetical protein
MSFEELDKKLQEAADLHHPAYHADAWSKMEKLLDEHLPVKDKKRRRIIFWWFIPLLLGGTFLTSRFILKSNKPAADKTSSSMVTVTNQKKDNYLLQSKSVALKEKANLKNLTIDEKLPIKSTTSIPQQKSLKETGLNKIVKQIETDNQFNSQPYLVTNEKISTKVSTDILTTKEDQNINVTVINKSITQPSVNNNSGETVVESSASVKTENKVAQVPTTPVTNEKSKNTINTSTSDSILKKETTSSSKSKKKNQFFVSFSAAADVSYVSGNNPGTAKIISGGGIGYFIKDKITIRAGFYAGRKVYRADGNSYKGDAIFYQYYPYLESVNANCRVYEIPLSASINFAKRKKDNLFASAGISTLLMKKETYDYYYKHTPAGSLYEKSWTINNKNKHFFSVLTLSGGYQHILGKKTFFIVEPYLKMPLGGVGAGKIKLNSTGILITAGVKLF